MVGIGREMVLMMMMTMMMIMMIAVTLMVAMVVGGEVKEEMQDKHRLVESAEAKLSLLRDRLHPNGVDGTDQSHTKFQRETKDFDWKPFNVKYPKRPPTQPIERYLL